MWKSYDREDVVFLLLDVSCLDITQKECIAERKGKIARLCLDITVESILSLNGETCFPMGSRGFFSPGYRRKNKTKDTEEYCDS